MLRFAAVDLTRHFDTCVRFREDSYICSFGDATQFYGDDNRGVDRYSQFLTERMASFPGSCQHAWLGDRIVGQLEMGRVRADASIGYVNLFYLIPEMRGQGLGAELDDRAECFFVEHGVLRARLSVSVQNACAWRFYMKRGWVDQGPSSEPGVHWLDKQY